MLLFPIRFGCIFSQPFLFPLALFELLCLFPFVLVGKSFSLYWRAMTDDFIDNYANYVSLVLATVLVFFSSISVSFFFIFLFLFFFDSDQPVWNTVFAFPRRLS